MMFRSILKRLLRNVHNYLSLLERTPHKFGMPHSFLFFLAMALTCVPAKLACQDFVLQGEENGVSVYTRAEEDGQLSVRVETEIASTVPRVKATLDDAERYAEWVHRCDGAYIVEGGQADSYLFVSGIDMPFPFGDKEVVARIQQHVRPDGSLVRLIVGDAEAVPASGRDRPGVYEGEWVVTPLTGHGVSIRVTVRTDAGAGLPLWLRKEVMTGGPVKTVINLRRRLEAAR